jgi:hypothetical protein
MITLLPRVTVDFEALMAALLTYPGLTVIPRLDADSLAYNSLPLITFAGANGAAVSYVGGATRWDLFLSLYVEGLEQGGDVADTVYQITHNMAEHGIAGVGEVVDVDDVAMFDRFQTAEFADKLIVQYNAQFSVLVQPTAA